MLIYIPGPRKLYTCTAHTLTHTGSIVRSLTVLRVAHSVFEPRHADRSIFEYLYNELTQTIICIHIVTSGSLLYIDSSWYILQHLMILARGYKLFSCSTQLSMKFFMLINLKLLTMPNSFFLNIAEHENISANKYENANYCWHFHIY